MDVLRAIVLGAVQGLTEFLPISSSAHLIIIPWLFGWEESGLTFDVALHLGTLVAVLVYFRREIFQIAVAVPRGLIERRPLADPMARMGWIIILGSIPAAIVGFVANDTIDSFFHGGAGGNTAIVLVALLLIALGALLALAERVAKHCRPVECINAGDGLVVGLAQALALLPGVSRSGSTITAALFRGLQRDAAARFSFLLGIPAIVGAGVLETRSLMETGLAPGEGQSFLAGMATAAIVGYLAIAFLLRYLRTRSTMIFVVYRLGLGVLLLALVATGVR
ncbi:undecaprenyl-diphosphatase UppP [Sphaerobacter thermophilus]|uniref:Undecaprenyl-diphosphatase n=1 Tax=Sphaerobacter thermophilus (strain ATCC 49802 / DSM 20745 / KCCM 41009 / NCIMB 13125 / S 6022) TaxID=479434 RepID=D1C5P5_SPHTD|nr:undecaprenyl-diphosphatase UppP [Sphaerobacter thermophilus]ACZ39447.1 undecaprenol kinase [Sphaerobacter thermophilus DSM 20745]